MKLRRVWLLVFCAGFVAICACVPKYTTKPQEPPRTAVSDAQVEAILEEAELAYQEGVDLFVREEHDSARTHLESAISLLSRDIDWSSHGPALSERRILLYKCRYFLERLPVRVTEVLVEPKLEDIVPLRPMLPPVEIVDNDKVQKWIRYFTGEGKQTFAKWLKRSGKYKSHMARIFKEEGLPPKIVNLAMIESGFNPDAYSRAHAVGMWQFIRSTGRIYGLRIDWWVDERRDPIRSGRAAATHLVDLYRSLDSWPLVLAAYNCGQRNVERAIMRARSRDYWRLRLPRETRDFVPKFMAASLIMADPHAYGFDVVLDDPMEYDEIEVGPKTDLKAIARACQASTSEIKELNPHLIRGCAPDGKASYPVRIPRGKLEVCANELARIPRAELVAKVYESPTVKHTVRRGDTLSRIASMYGTTIAAIGKANRLANYHRIKVGQVLLIPGDGYVSYPENPGVHVVRRGETLSNIARRYKVALRSLIEWNNLPSAHLIYSGQKLVVSLENLPQDRVVIHVVKKGETISTIAKQYRASTRAVLSANGLGSRDNIYPGQEVKVPVSDHWKPAGQVATHTVRRGETITAIAKRYGVSVKEVLSANGLGSTDKIYPGQKVRIGGDRREEVTTHTVAGGETVTKIAQTYGTTVDAVLKANGLRADDKIYPGQTLIIFPGEVPEAVLVYHKVTRGDTISSIARKYGTSVQKVLDINGLGSADKIYPGQKIKIPID